MTPDGDISGPEVWRRENKRFISFGRGDLRNIGAGGCSRSTRTPGSQLRILEPLRINYKNATF